MKRKSLTVGLSLVALSGVAALSGTFAWFSTNRSAAINFTDATIRNRAGNLSVEYIKSFNTMLANQTTDAFGDAKIDLTVDKTKDDAKYVTDISGDGLAFNKLTWSSVPNYNGDRLDGVSPLKAGEINEIEIKKAGDADGHFIDFSVKISRDNKSSDHGLLVYLGEGTRILPKIEDPATFTDTFDKDGNIVMSAYSKYREQQLSNIHATKSARLAVNNLQDLPVDEDGLTPEENGELPFTKFVYAQEREYYNNMPIPGEDIPGEYMYLQAMKDAGGNFLPGYSAYQYAGFALRDLHEVRDGAVRVVPSGELPVGKAVTLIGDPAHGIEDVTYDFISGFKSYQNVAQLNEIENDIMGFPLPAWRQPYNYGLIADLSTNNNTVEYVNFRIWTEGTDLQAHNNIIGGVYTVELDIYTVEVLKN